MPAVLSVACRTNRQIVRVGLEFLTHYILIGQRVLTCHASALFPLSFFLVLTYYYGMSDDEFPARLFPTSFTLLHCPYGEACSYDAPFTDPLRLVEHMTNEHGLLVNQPKAVLPFLDRYLEARIRNVSTRNSIDEDADRSLRYALQQERLGEILTVQAQERATLHCTGRNCLFCNLYAPNHPELFSHMYRKHAFNIGQLDNLVMVGEFLDALQRRLEERICIYCEGRFPSMPTLKKHLKNKGHYRIHPQNHIYDKYYIVNYLLPGTLYDAQAEERIVSEAADEDEGDHNPGNRSGNDEDAAWGELDEELIESTICLLCPQSHNSVEACLEHMRQVHDFDWSSLIARGRLDETETIQLLNYMRSRQINSACAFCPPPPKREEGNDGKDDIDDDEFEADSQDESTFLDENVLAEHLQTHRPFHTLPPNSYWKTTRFLFPVLEDDPLLWHANGDEVEAKAESDCREHEFKDTRKDPFVQVADDVYNLGNGAK